MHCIHTTRHVHCNILQSFISALSSKNIVGIHLDDICCPHKEWVPGWNAHLAGSSSDVRVPQEATAITTLLNAMNWASLLSTHPNQELVQFLLTGISEGIRIGFKNSQKPLKSAKRNLGCALQHPDAVSQYLAKEIAHHQVAGPFKRSTIPDAHVSRFGVIPQEPPAEQMAPNHRPFSSGKQ